MKFTPIRAATIFLVAMSIPSIPVIGTFWRPSISAIRLLPGILLIYAVAFWAGARLSARPHTIKSLALSILGTWSFGYAGRGLIKDFSIELQNTDQVFQLVQWVFVFLVAWRLAPKARVSPAGDGSDAAV